MSNEGQDDATIIRSDTSSPQTVVLVGNGAIEKGWEPLREAIDSLIADDSKVNPLLNKIRRQNSEAFHQLALLSYKFKVCRGLAFAGWSKFKKGNADQTSLQATSKTGFAKPILTFLQLRKGIADSFKKSAPRLTLRRDSEIDKILGNAPHFITTNWDNTLWKDHKNKNLIQLHGRCDFPNSLVFPTELLIEDAAYDLSIFTKAEVQGLSQPFAQELISTFRSDHLEALINAHLLSTHWLQHAKRLIIWGYSLGDYDADINALVATHTPTHLDELIVINTDPAAFYRAVALTGITNAWLYNPALKTTIKLA